MSALAAPAAETVASFPCFGSECTVIVAAPRPVAEAAVSSARAQLLDWHRRFSRFEPDSELTRLNEDARGTVPVSPLMRRVLEAGLAAARHTGGLVDPTLVPEIEHAGYTGHLPGPGLPLAQALALAPPRFAAGAGEPRWEAVEVDRRAGTVTRPPGVRFDSGGIAKGVFADELGTLLSSHAAYVVDCGGDLRLGGRAGAPRQVHVASPFDERGTLHTFTLTDGAAATSGIGRRSWRSESGAPAHHLLDPRTGRPAFTGVVQATALAPTATEAEMLSKAAVLSGTEGAREVLARHGGAIVLEDGATRVLEPV